MRISHFWGARDKIPKQAEITWDSFCAGFGPHAFQPGGATEAEDKAVKESLLSFSPAEYPDAGPTDVDPDLFPEWGRRAAENVVRVWMFVLDVDNVPRETLDALVAFVQQQGLAAVVYSTWSHAKAFTTKGLCKFRVIVPLDRPVDGASWKQFWFRAQAMFANLCDPACKDASRLFFGPIAPTGTEALNFFWVLQGNALPVDAVMSMPLPEGATEDPVLADAVQVAARDRDAVAMLVAAWPQQRRHEAHLALAGGLLSSGVTDERAVNFLCAVAAGQDGYNEDRFKRQATVEHTRHELDANQPITGWATLASIVGYDVVERVRELVERAPPIDDLQLMRYAQQLQRSKIDRKAELGDALKKVCQQRVFPEPLVLKLATELGERFHDYDAHSIALRFTDSLHAMRSEGEDVTVAQVEARIKQRQDEVRAQRKEQKQKQQALEERIEFDKATRIRDAYRNGRSHPYTPEELAQWPQITTTGHRWILQKDHSYYFFFNGSYSQPYSEAEAHNGALRELAPASTAGVELLKTTKDGTDFKPLRTLVAEYGTVAERVITDLRAQTISYDENDRAIIEAPCPLRKLEPLYDPDVDRWMYELAGPEEYDDLKTWFALLPYLDEVRAALALIGEHSVGKSMSALGASRLWTKDGPCSLSQALAPFNDSILRCPLIFADEHLPKDLKGNVPTEQLREFIQARDRPLKRKHMPNSKCLGVTPLLIAAHDLEVLRPSENVSNNEVAGSVQRFKIIRVRRGAAEFLASLHPTTHQRGWVDHDVIAKHIWWLVYNHRHERKGRRFYFESKDADTAMWFATSGGGKSALLRWLVSYLGNRAKFESDVSTEMLVRVYQGKLLVNLNGVLNHWEKYVTNEKCPSSGLLARLLADISEPERKKIKNGRGHMTNYRVIISEYLYAWAKNTDMVSAEVIAEALSQDSVATTVGIVRRPGYN